MHRDYSRELLLVLPYNYIVLFESKDELVLYELI
jgi:hypothetical protein